MLYLRRLRLGTPLVRTPHRIFGGRLEDLRAVRLDVRQLHVAVGWWRRLLVQRVDVPLEPPREDADGEVQAAEGRVVQHDHEIHPFAGRVDQREQQQTKRTRRRQRPDQRLERLEVGRTARVLLVRRLHGHVAHPGRRRGEDDVKREVEGRRYGVLPGKHLLE